MDLTPTLDLGIGEAEAILAGLADVFFQAGHEFTAAIADHHAVGRRAGIAARSAIAIGGDQVFAGGGVSRP